LIIDYQFADPSRKSKTQKSPTGHYIPTLAILATRHEKTSNAMIMHPKPHPNSKNV
jgi:hypothetical protein